MITTPAQQCFLLPNEECQIRLGRHVGEALKWRGQIWLTGDLGVGKTTLTRGILRSAGHTGAVKSPTYALIEPYNINGLRIHHLDLYRLSDPEELAFIGVRELFDEDSLAIIEWPSMGAGELPTPDLIIRLALALPGRHACVRAASAAGAVALEHLRLAAADLEVAS